MPEPQDNTITWELATRLPNDPRLGCHVYCGSDCVGTIIDIYRFEDGLELAYIMDRCEVVPYRLVGLHVEPVNK